MEVIVASSSEEGGIGCWDLQTGAEQLRYKTCTSPPQGLVSVGQRFLASSQLRDPSASTGSVFYWSWSKPQIDVKSFLAEPLRPIASNHEGTYIVGGGISGNIYLWEVVSGRLLKKWYGHYGAVTCLVFFDDSLLISGADDGSVKVWSLLMIFDDIRQGEAKHLHEYSFNEHRLRVTDIVAGYGGSNAIIVSASEDCTCKVWSLSKGKLLRNIIFPSKINAIALDPAEHVFYAGGADGKIYIAALNTKSTHSSDHGMHIITSLTNHSNKAVTCLAFSSRGNLLISGSEDGMVRVWNARTRDGTHNIIRVLKHAKGPVNNILVVTQQLCVNSQFNPTFQASSRRHTNSLLPPLGKYANSTDDIDFKAVIGLHSNSTDWAPSYLSSHVIDSQIKELKREGSAAAAEMDMGRMKADYKRSLQMVQKWKQMYENLAQFCVNEVIDCDET